MRPGRSISCRSTGSRWSRSRTAAPGTRSRIFRSRTRGRAARSIGNRVGEAGILAKRAEAFVTRGDIDAARPDAEAAIGITAELGLRPHLARTQRAWGEALRAAGLATEAEPHLQKAATLFDELGLDAEAKAVLAELAMGETKIAFD